MKIPRVSIGSIARISKMSNAGTSPPEEHLKYRALLELMYSETFARQEVPDFELAAQLSFQFVDKYSAQNGEDMTVLRATALAQAGMFSRKASDMDRAYQAYSMVLKDFPDGLEYFSGLHPHAQALYGLARLAVRQGDKQTNDELMSLLISQYPDEILTQLIMMESPDLETGLEQ